MLKMLSVLVAAACTFLLGVRIVSPETQPTFVLIKSKPKSLVRISDHGVSIIGKTSMVFDIRSCSGAAIILSQLEGGSNTLGQKYWFLALGMVNNTKHVLRQGCQACASVSRATTRDVLSCTEFRKLWIAWTSTGHFAFGTGPLIQHNTILRYEKGEPITPFFMFVSGNDVKAKWKFYVGDKIEFLYPKKDGSTLVELNENLKLGTVMVNINISLETSVHFSVESTPEKLCLVQNSQVILNKKLDYEEQKMYSVRIITQTGFSVAFKVRVKDLNDEVPVITLGNRLRILEELPVGTPVKWFFTATDADADDILNITINKEAKRFFIVKPDGSLVLIRRIDRDGPHGLTSFNLTVRAEDTAGHATSRDLHVTVDDVNDNVPVCSQRFYSVSVEENTKQDVELLRVNCTDVDDGDNGKLTTTLVSDLGGKFFVNGGVVYARRGRLDYEALQHAHFSLQLEINVSDAPPSGNVLTARINVLVKVLPRNEHAPTWLFPPSVGADVTIIKVPESVSVGFLVTTLKASDADVGEGSTVLYKLLHTELGKTSIASETFSVDPVTGRLRTSKPLDSDTTGDAHDYILTVAATDGSKLTENKLKIVIKDVNDNPPQFDQPIYVTDVITNTSVGLPVLFFKVSDKDKGSKVTVFLGDEVTDLFKVEVSGGGWYLVLITPNINLIPDVFVLLASDHGEPEMVGKAHVVTNRSNADLDLTTLPPTTPTTQMTTSLLESGICIIPKGFTRFITTIGIKMPWKKVYGNSDTSMSMRLDIQKQMHEHFSKMPEFQNIVVKQLSYGSVYADLEVHFSREVNFSRIFSVITQMESSGFQIQKQRQKMIPYVSTAPRPCSSADDGEDMLIIIVIAESLVMIILAIVLAVKCFTSRKKTTPVTQQFWRQQGYKESSSSDKGKENSARKRHTTVKSVRFDQTTDNPLEKKPSSRITATVRPMKGETSEKQESSTLIKHDSDFALIAKIDAHNGVSCKKLDNFDLSSLEKLPKQRNTGDRQANALFRNRTTLDRDIQQGEETCLERSKSDMDKSSTECFNIQFSTKPLENNCLRSLKGVDFNTPIPLVKSKTSFIHRQISTDTLDRPPAFLKYKTDLFVKGRNKDVKISENFRSYLDEEARLREKQCAKDGYEEWYTIVNLDALEDEDNSFGMLVSMAPTDHRIFERNESIVCVEEDVEGKDHREEASVITGKIRNQSRSRQSTVPVSEANTSIPCDSPDSHTTSARKEEHDLSAIACHPSGEPVGNTDTREVDEIHRDDSDCSSDSDDPNDEGTDQINSTTQKTHSTEGERPKKKKKGKEKKKAKKSKPKKDESTKAKKKSKKK